MNRDEHQWTSNISPWNPQKKTGIPTSKVIPSRNSQSKRWLQHVTTTKSHGCFQTFQANGNKLWLTANLQFWHPPSAKNLSYIQFLRYPPKKKQVAGGGNDNIVDVIFSNVPNNWNDNCPLSTIHLGVPCMESPRPPKYIMLQPSIYMAGWFGWWD